MNLPRFPRLLLTLCPLLMLLTANLPADSAPDPTWQAVNWNGERALASSSAGWKAVVSLQRSRLMYFGPAAAENNLLLAPPTRANRNLLGGHRLWLGPQNTWAKGWPPPVAWEYSEADTVSSVGAELRLLMPDAGDGWPRLTRTYRWDGDRLICGAEIAGGTRPAQIVQIVQTPASTGVTAEARAETDFPAGYVELPSTAGPFAARFVEPPHVHRTDAQVSLQHMPPVVKLGFRPQTLRADCGSYALQVGRGEQTGTVVSGPDAGFFTQVYLGGPEAVIELEQLSPLFAAGRPARFEMVLKAATR